MNKEEILEKSRAENKNQDIYEKEVIKQAASLSIIVSAILATIFFVIQVFAGGGINYGLYALVFSMNMSIFWTKYAKLKKKHELILAVCNTVFVMMLSIAHIYQLLTSSMF